MSKLLLPVAVALGFGITWIDQRPTWDDTGVTAGMILISAALFGALQPRRPWLWALAIGAWIPLIGIVRDRNFATLIALAVSFAGAYAGTAARGLLVPVRD